MEDKKIVEEIKQICADKVLTQGQIAEQIGVSRIYVNNLLNGKKTMTVRMREALIELLLQYSVNSVPEILFDYCRIRFPTQDVEHVIEDILQLRMYRMLHEERGFYGYTERYVFGDIMVMTSPDKLKGVLLELKGKGCRQFERYLEAQGRTWYQFLHQCVSEGGKMRRIDLAINDRVGVLDIPYLIEKAKRREYVSIFKKFETHGSWQSVSERTKQEKCMGQTLYCGSMKSQIYFCIYQKDYEQYIKNGIELEDTDVKNRFELRLSEERAELTVQDLLAHENPYETVFGIIETYLRFVEKREEKKDQKDWKTDSKWEQFVPKENRAIKLTVKPEPYSFDKTLRWFAKQVAPLWKTAVEIDRRNDTNHMEYILEHAELKERHQKLIEQQTMEAENFIMKKEK